MSSSLLPASSRNRALRRVRIRRLQPAPIRSAPFEMEPGYYESGALWLYGNVRLLRGKLATVERALGRPIDLSKHLEAIEKEAEQLVLDGHVLVCGIHNYCHQRAAIVPLRWGSPRIVIMSGGFRYHLGKELKDEPFRIARLWRYQWDPGTDLAVSRRAPDKSPTFAHYNPSLDRLIELLANREWPGLRWACDPLMPLLENSG